MRIYNGKPIHYKSNDYKMLYCNTIALMSANLSCLLFKDNFKNKRQGIIAQWDILIPEKDMFDAKGLIPLRKNDCDNFIKPIKDIVFGWLGFDDSHVFTDIANKECSDNWGYRVTLKSFDIKKGK